MEDILLKDFENDGGLSDICNITDSSTDGTPTDDANVDDFMTWLLVNADTIDVQPETPFPSDVRLAPPLGRSPSAPPQQPSQAPVQVPPLAQFQPVQSAFRSLEQPFTSVPPAHKNPPYPQPQVQSSRPIVRRQPSTLSTRLGIGLSPPFVGVDQKQTQVKEAGRMRGSVGDTASKVKISTRGANDTGSRPYTPTLRTPYKAEPRHRQETHEMKKRKRQPPEELEEHLKKLTEENEQLKLHLQNTEEKNQKITQQKFQMEANLKKMLKDGSKESEIESLLKKYKDLYADYGEQRKKEIDFHLSQLHTLLLPTQTTKMSLWTLEQDDNFYLEEPDDTSLMHILTEEMGLSQDQKQRIKAHRTKILDLVEDLKRSIQLMQKIRDMVQAKHKKFDKHMGILQSFLTPTQLVQLLLWITDNKQVLESFVPGFKDQTAASISEMSVNKCENFQFL